VTFIFKGRKMVCKSVWLWMSSRFLTTNKKADERSRNVPLIRSIPKSISKHNTDWPRQDKNYVRQLFKPLHWLWWFPGD